MGNETGLGRQAETRSRSVRVGGLPPATQEGLLQQLLEKHALVKRVEVFLDQNEAVIELENAAVSVHPNHAIYLYSHKCPVGRRLASCCFAQSQLFLTGILCNCRKRLQVV